VSLRPEWVVLVPAVVLLGATLWWARHHPTARPADRVMVSVRVALAVAAVAIGLHPVDTVRVGATRETDVDLVLVVDRTTSMGARDLTGDRPRMAGVAADLGALLDQVAGARVAVVVFDDDARLAVPFTADATTVAGYLQVVGWRPSAKATGSDISVGIGLTRDVLTQAAAEHPDHRRYLVYAGDGEQTAESAPASFAPLRSLVDGALVLGYGTPEGGPMTTTDSGDDLIRIRGEVQVSRYDEAALRTVADQLGATYEHRTGPGPLPDVVEPGTAESGALVPGREYYWLVALGAAAGLLVLLGGATAALRAVREEVVRAP
jgi:Ca-activated chloride channel homolog